MRWVALGVDYEMYGKDLIDSVDRSRRRSRACSAGARPRASIYEMFLDEKGEKISKSKGNGLSIEQWLTYGPDESLAFYIYREPKKAKSLHMGVIPRAVDEYWQFRAQLSRRRTLKQRLGNPVHHIHDGTAARRTTLPVTFGLLLNLVGVMGDGDQGAGLGLSRQLSARRDRRRRYPELDRLIGYALAYARDFVAPTLKRRAPEGVEVAALERLDAELAALPDGCAGGGYPEHRLRDRQDRRVRRAARLVQGAVRDAAGVEPGPADGQLHRALRRRQYAQLIAEALAR